MLSQIGDQWLPRLLIGGCTCAAMVSISTLDLSAALRTNDRPSCITKNFRQRTLTKPVHSLEHARNHTMMSTSQSLLKPSTSLQAAFKSHCRPGIRGRYLQVRAEVKRSFNEDKGKVSSGDEKKPLYADEAPVSGLRAIMAPHCTSFCTGDA